MVLLFFASIVTAGKPPVKYWIRFTDKNNSPYSISNPSAFLGPKALNRRAMYQIAVDETDLPVNPSYVAKVASVPNVKVLYASRWMNGVVIRLDSADLAPAALSAISGFSFVTGNRQVQKYKVSTGYKAEPAPVFLQRNSQSQATTSSGRGTYGGSFAQIHQLDADCLHDRGFRGQGMTIGVMDAGFYVVDSSPIFDSLRNRGGILGTRDFVSGGDNAYNGSTHGTMVMSCLAALIPGKMMGTAPLANYWLFRTEAPEENLSEEYNWIKGAEFADSVGCDVLTTSLGYTEFDDPAMDHSYAMLNGKTAPMSIAATMAARKGMLVFNAAGNERASSWHYIGVPADADSIITVGAIDSLGREAAFSSVGPTSDGRIKPDFVAIGAWSYVGVDQPSGFPANGTSFATPILAGAATCYWQSQRYRNNMSVITALRKHASNALYPNNGIGWGIPDLCPEESFDFDLQVNRSRKVLNIYLADTDYSEIRIELVDLNGRRLFNHLMNPGERAFALDVATLADGIYVVRMKTSNGSKSKKIALGGL